MAERYTAQFYEAATDNRLRCHLCPHNCLIADGKSGICGARKNSGGVLYAETYGMITAIAMDPIEKKPLYHYYPGSRILSIGSRGCNLRCPFCQNWHISQDDRASTSYYSPEDIVTLALKNDSIGVAYTYNEPVIWAEYVIDTSRMARAKGLRNVMVSNGYINPAPLDDLLGVVDAFNIDLKSFNDETYKKALKGRLANVRESIERIFAAGRHLEVTTLIVTGMNDSLAEMEQIYKFIASIDRKIPWHISRYYPNYKYHKDATDTDFLFKVYEEASKLLDYVYTGNVQGTSRGSDTICPGCGAVAINRKGYYTSPVNCTGGKCSKCGADLNIIH
ncbi:MAG TPA: AmmeMemoRadiSam system radical SAM enzyme [Spirochaetota bacterium]|mgnify:CR=1 FL=1|nr:AmmeMemoRadiSam system radical SAM enzyme [Spirochaetota bacterium]HPI88722.1 AmmeMemoRadiSam system radical SAM enzyme [Spirochaetota bacterium]